MRCSCEEEKDAGYSDAPPLSPVTLRLARTKNLDGDLQLEYFLMSKTFALFGTL